MYSYFKFCSSVSTIFNYPKTYSGVVESDPSLQNHTFGEKIKFRQISLAGEISNKENILTESEIKVPTPITSDLVKGALVGVCLDKGDNRTELIGTAFVIGAGIAVTAAHVIRDDMEDLASGKARCICVAFRDNKLVLWEIRSINVDDSDIAFLSISALSSFPSNYTYHQFGLTTFTPKIGDTIRIFGYKQLERLESQDKNEAYLGIAGVYVTEGKITQFYPRGRDKVFLPHPCYELDCGTLSGMSGGVAIDERGFVIGVVSTSYGEHGPTYISWICSAFKREITTDWPNGVNMDTTILKEAMKSTSEPKFIFVENYKMNMDSDGNLLIPNQPHGDVSNELASSRHSTSPT